MPQLILCPHCGDNLKVQAEELLTGRPDLWCEGCGRLWKAADGWAGLICMRGVPGYREKEEREPKQAQEKQRPSYANGDPFDPANWIGKEVRFTIGGSGPSDFASHAKSIWERLEQEAYGSADPFRDATFTQQDYRRGSSPLKPLRIAPDPNDIVIYPTVSDETAIVRSEEE